MVDTERGTTENKDPIESIPKPILAIVSSIHCFVMLGVTLIIPILEVAIGASYRDQCPMNPNIPIYLIVTGACGMASIVLVLVINGGFIWCIKRNSIAVTFAMLCLTIIIGLFILLMSLFLFAWFIVVSVLESLERDECKSLIEKYGGRVTLAISGKTNYLIVGRDASEGKTNKAREIKIKMISEDDLLEMIRTCPGDKSTSKKQLSTTTKSSSTTLKRKSSSTVSKPIDEPDSIISSTTSVDKSNLLWVDKYKPQTIKNLIGQQGEKSCVQKLIVWLRDWYKHHGHSDEKVKAKPSFTFNRNEDPAMFKAALLSGPPGIGKTTAAQLVCQHLNFEYIEKNASDQRSKKSMTNLPSDTYSVANFSNKTSSISKYVLIMDEVDGVSGNEDRGGVQELISLIKRTRIPIICICNDRQHKKIRSLSNYCYDLRFHRPTIQQIRAGMLTILHRENIQNIKQDILDEIIKSCNHDIRQTIHTLNLWSIQGTTNTNKVAAKMIEKTINTNPFELCRISFSDEFREKSLTDKSDIFFYDYQLMPLLIQENYLQCQPHLSTINKQKRTLSDIEHLNLISKAADSICLGDVCSQMIFSKNESWSLLPYQVSFQLKIFTTAIFTVLILRRPLNLVQWLALFLLFLGISLVQIENMTSTALKHDVNAVLGLISVVSACILSGLAGVYFEKILKCSDVSVWIRNIQLGIFGMLFGFLTVYISDGAQVKTKGFLFGYTDMVWVAITVQSAGGLLVALVVKYADNILKGFATSSAIIISCVISIGLFDFQLTFLFAVGTILVIFSIFLYSKPELITHIPVFNIIFKEISVLF
ncbi:unnamed protein product [Rotaria sp. Silwood1]|nr:unnamed protein product [Rotaria sp. Silwood1]